MRRTYRSCPDRHEGGFAADDLLGIDASLTPRARRLACLVGTHDSFGRAQRLLSELSGLSLALTAPLVSDAVSADGRLIGAVTETGTATASAQYALDNGAFAPLTLGPAGNFEHWTRSLPANGAPTSAPTSTEPCPSLRYRAT